MILLPSSPLLVGAGECLLAGLAVGGLGHPTCELTHELFLVYLFEIGDFSIKYISI